MWDAVACGDWLATILRTRHPMAPRIQFSRPTVKGLTAAWHRAFQRGELRLVKRIAALVLVAEQVPVATVAERVGMSESTIYGWLHAFLHQQFASLAYRTSPGRPAKLTPTQKQRLYALVAAGPEAAGYATGCWNSAVIQDLMQREFGVLYSVHYVAELLKNLGFSYQKARFVSDHLDEDRRARWRTVSWPQIRSTAERQGALLLFGDEASFAQWGSLGYTWAPRGQQPLVRTTGKRKGYKVFGLIDYFSGRLFSHGHAGRFTADSYCAFLATVPGGDHAAHRLGAGRGALSHRRGHAGLLRCPCRPADGLPTPVLLARL